MEKWSVTLSGGRGVFIGEQRRQDRRGDIVRKGQKIRVKLSERRHIVMESRITRQAYRCTEKDKEIKG